MSQYQFIEAICDAFGPGLSVCVLVLIIRSVVHRQFHVAALTFAFLTVGMVLVYSIKYMDDKYRIWAYFGLDYSTHTAFVLAVCVAISVILNAYKSLVLLVIVYALLLLYQEYHTLGDISTTIVVIGSPLLIFRYSQSRRSVVADR